MLLVVVILPAHVHGLRDTAEKARGYENNDAEESNAGVIFPPNVNPARFRATLPPPIFIAGFMKCGCTMMMMMSTSDLFTIMLRRDNGAVGVPDCIGDGEAVKAYC